jgi:hypothetical protein
MRVLPRSLSIPSGPDVHHMHDSCFPAQREWNGLPLSDLVPGRADASALACAQTSRQMHPMKAGITPGVVFVLQWGSGRAER